MIFKPFDEMKVRVDAAKKESAREYFDSLLLYAELVAKFTVLGMVSAVDDGKELNQYRLRHRLVKAKGIGEWSHVLDEILTGVTNLHLHQAITAGENEAKQLNASTRSGAWQHKCVRLLRKCVLIADPNQDAPTDRRIKGKTWLSEYATLRNKTKGHGAPLVHDVQPICPLLSESIDIFVTNFGLFQRPWAYLRQTLRSKYHIVRWNTQAHRLDMLATSRARQLQTQFPDGVYVQFGTQINRDSMRLVQLVAANSDLSDFLVLNGGMNTNRYEMLSYVTGQREYFDAKEYRIPVTQLQNSETLGLPEMVQSENSGDTLDNLPSKPDEYVSRKEPEDDLYNEIVNDTPHRIVTLRGRGGIGKTCLTLEVLHRIAKERHFKAIVWFSSRDTDLAITGMPKRVRPQVLNEKDIAEVFKNLLGEYFLSYDAMNDRSIDLEFLRQNLKESVLGPILYVFDNFETVTDPIGLYQWIYYNLGQTNKAVITTRVRDFKGDYDIELQGMSEEECVQLIDRTVRRLGIAQLISHEDKHKLINVSEGHPYVLRLLLGEVKKSNRRIELTHTVMSHTDMLDALFERTYSQQLNPVAKRVFLTLCNWKSLFAEYAMEAVILRPENGIRDISEAIETLDNCSLIRRRVSAKDGETYLDVPLVARQFGQRKLKTSTMKPSIERDHSFLEAFGPTQISDLSHDHVSRLKRFLVDIKSRVMRNDDTIEDVEPILRYIAKRKYPDALLSLADIYEKLGDGEGVENALISYLEISSNEAKQREVWERLANHRQILQKYYQEIQARIQLAQFPRTSYAKISNAVKRFNNVNSSNNSQGFRFHIRDKEELEELLIELMEDRIDEANDDDYSLLGWLYMQSKQNEKALQAAEQGLRLNPANNHCLNLKKKALDALDQLPS